MSFTSHSIDDNGFPLSSGASADYGFDEMIYFLLGQNPPTQNELNNLAKRYKQIIDTTTNSRELLHKNYKNKTLKELLGDGFEWVKTTNDLPM